MCIPNLKLSLKLEIPCAVFFLIHLKCKNLPITHNIYRSISRRRNTECSLHLHPAQAEQTLNSVKGYYGRLPIKTPKIHSQIRTATNASRKGSSTSRPNQHLLHHLAPTSTWLYFLSQPSYGLKPPAPEDDNKTKSVSGN